MNVLDINKLNKDELFTTLLEKRVTALEQFNSIQLKNGHAPLIDLHIQDNKIVFNGKFEDCNYILFEGVYEFDVVGSRGIETLSFNPLDSNLMIIKSIKKAANNIDCKGLKNLL